MLVTVTIVGWQLASTGDPVQTHTVAMEGMTFLTGVLRIRAGDRVVFKNNDLVQHITTNKETGLDQFHRVGIASGACGFSWCWNDGRAPLVEFRSGLLRCSVALAPVRWIQQRTSFPQFFLAMMSFPDCQNVSSPQVADDATRIVPSDHDQTSDVVA